MQALRGSIRLVRRQSISNLSGVDSKSNISCSAAAKFHGSSIGSLSKFLYRPAVSYTRIGSQTETSTASSNGILSVSVACRSSRPDLFQRAAVMPPFICRCFSTAENLVESASQDSSACVSDVAPHIKFKRLDKTAKHIMQACILILDIDKEAVEEVRAERKMPDIKPGYIVQLKVEVPENKRRVSILKGIVIARRNAGLNSTFRLRRLVAGVGVESLFPLYSPNIKEIKVLDKKKVRRAKLYYLRDKMNALKKQ
ncbi:hypothetical protein FH972_015569 [Carpinus fangiana]|uniref:Ribosomal protein L19 n=1 Tax=Carpinus fangiana TaxID=176857 RepID=A0A5N6RDG3_9ROSI|nr:hypothetical protein FH972_015569 [Carpinus fangiana]